MEKPVKQHYVPRFYLRSFSTATKQNAVYAYRLSEKKLFGPVLVDHVARENYFYDLDDKTSIEDDFALLESQVATVHRRILETRNLSPLSTHEFAAYAYFVATQSRRTRRARDDVQLALNLMADAGDLPDTSEASREHIRKTGGAVLSEFEQILPSVIDKALTDAGLVSHESREAKRSEALDIAMGVLDKYRTYLADGQLPPDVQQGMREAAADPRSVKRLHLNALPVTASRAAKSLVLMNWYPIPTASEEPLITSDNPVVVLDGSLQSTQNGSFESLPMILGYADWNEPGGNLKPSLRILMPLSPSLMLLMTPVSTLQIQPIDNDGVAALNSLVAAQAKDFLYGTVNNFTSAMPGVNLRSTSIHALEAIRRLVLSTVGQAHGPLKDW